MNHFWKFSRVAYAPEGEGGGAPPPTEETPVENPPPEEEAPPEPEAPPAPQMVPVDVMQRRVSTLSRQKADLERELELLKLGQTLEPKPGAPAPQAKPQGNLALEAQALAEQMRRDEKAAAVISAGQAIDPNFMVNVNTMTQTLGALPNHFIDAVMEAGETSEGAAKIFLELSKDLQQAGLLLSMTPTRMAVALAKMEKKPGKPAPTPGRQAAPSPITPKIGAGRPAPTPKSLEDPDMSMSDWVKQRDEAAKASRRW